MRETQTPQEEGVTEGKRQQSKPSDRKPANQYPSLPPSPALGEFESHGALQALQLLEHQSHQ